ncbi:MAG: TlpA family protein disulfide reductase [Bacteroidetes bacterium]|nr:TlpA family protein disulfide reductase [Bacteroidota bacterium]
MAKNINGIDQKKNKSKPLINPKHKNLIYTLGFLGIFLIFFVINNSGSEPEQGPYPPGYDKASSAEKGVAPSFELSTTDGAKINLNDYKGKVVILDFWATWCGPCRRGIPDLVELKDKYKDKGFEIIGITVDQANTMDQVIPFINNYKINYPVAYANSDIIKKYGGIDAIPTSFIIDKEGKIVSKHVGLIMKEQYIKEIEEIL